MTAPSYMAYALIGGVILVSFIAPFIVGFGDAWFVPLAILPFAALYAAYDRKLRRDEEANPDAHTH
jgi:hypothetical protein